MAVAMRLALLTAAWGGAEGWRTQGTLPSMSHFMTYVGKFCFDYKKGPDEEAGEFTFNVAGKVVAEPSDQLLPQPSTDGPPCWGPCKTQGSLYLMVFDDEDQHWKQAQERWDEMSCDDMLHYSSFALPLTLSSGSFNRTAFVHEKIRPRFWYFTFVACGVQVVEPLSYDIHTRNIAQGSQSEFGMDERGSLALQLGATIFFTTVTVCLRGVARRATGAEALRSRPLLRMLLFSALCSALGAGCLTLHFCIFALNGWGCGFVELMGAAWICGAKALLALLQLLTAKGWALFYAPEELGQRRLMLCIIGWIVFTSMACEIHAEFYRDWSTEIYLYESWPGLVILFLNVVLFTEAWRSMRETYRHETSQEVRVFYVVISSASLLYFLTLPVMCILAASFNPWSRAKWVARVEVFSRLVATLLLCFCLRPSRLDAMVHARLEDGLETVGELRDDIDEEDPDDNPGYRKASDDEVGGYRESQSEQGTERGNKDRDLDLGEPFNVGPAE